LGVRKFADGCRATFPLRPNSSETEKSLVFFQYKFSLVTSHPQGYTTSTRLRFALNQNSVGPIKKYIFYKKFSTFMRRFYLLNHFGFMQEPIVCGGK
jgi:hypothetical protein